MKKTFKLLFLLFLYLSQFGCKLESDNKDGQILPQLTVVDAMRNVMWKGELHSKIDLDTIAERSGLYGLGPEVYLRGELLIADGIIYRSKVDSTSPLGMTVREVETASAPFFVYTRVEEWESRDLKQEVRNIKDLENYLLKLDLPDSLSFALKLIGKVESAEIHIQNLAEGVKVSSPEEAHSGQKNFELIDQEVEIIGFYSQNHLGVFTHHDSFLHLHLITEDKRQMGHLDRLEIEKMRLFLPKGVF